MKVCVFSDVHGNGLAFEAAWPQMISAGADAYLFLGDLCGYYYDQLNIFEKLRTLPNLISIKGNHDQLFLEIAQGNDTLRHSYREKYGNSIEHLLSKDHADLKQWLSGLAVSYRSLKEDFRCFHGSPSDPMEAYVYPDSSLEEFRTMDTRFIFLGNTHYKMKREIGSTVIVNPGSLGQPRDAGWPSFAVVDLKTGDTQFHEVRYDREALLRQIEQMGKEQPAYLKDVLVRSVA